MYNCNCSENYKDLDLEINKSQIPDLLNTNKSQILVFDFYWYLLVRFAQDTFDFLLLTMNVMYLYHV